MLPVDPGELTRLLAGDRLVLGRSQEVAEGFLMELMRGPQMQAADGVNQQRRGESRHRQMGRVLLARLMW